MPITIFNESIRYTHSDDGLGSSKVRYGPVNYKETVARTNGC